LYAAPLLRYAGVVVVVVVVLFDPLNDKIDAPDVTAAVNR
jgi:hypothetical protein